MVAMSNVVHVVHHTSLISDTNTTMPSINTSPRVFDVACSITFYPGHDIFLIPLLEFTLVLF